MADQFVIEPNGVVSVTVTEPPVVGAILVAGPRGDTGPSGATGPAGTAASVTVGTVSTGAEGSSATVTNAGSPNAAILNFTIPVGARGSAGPVGATGPAGTTSWNGLVDKPAVIAAGTDQTSARAVIGAEASANKGQPNGYASLDANAQVPASQLPSYVDDVIDLANLAAFPAPGEQGKIYVARDSGKIYRWSGSQYIEISASPGSTDAVPEGSTNLYFTDGRAQSALTSQLAGKSNVGHTHAQSDITGLTTDLANKAAAVHTHAQSDITGLTTDLAGKEPTITAGTTAQFWRGDKSWQALNKAAVGLGNVDNTSDANKPVSTATQTALDGKAASSHTHAQGDITGLTSALAGKLDATATAAAASKLTPGATINGVTFDGTTGITVADGTKLVAPTVTSVKTAAYSAAVSEIVMCNATAGGFTVTLPTGVADKARIIVKKIDSSANVVTVETSGADVFNSAGSGLTSLTLPLLNQALTAQYQASAGVWVVINTDIPLSQTDARYLGISATAAAATKLASARNVLTNLASTSAAGFDGTADNTHGVTGTLGIANGGTGNTSGNAAGLITPAAVIGPLAFSPKYVSGNYYIAGNHIASAVSNTLGNNTLRFSPWIVTDTITITRLWAHFTTSGDANSVLRIGIYNNDSSTMRPSSLVLDAGTISTGTGNAGNVATGGTAGVYEITVSQALSPGMYWVCGVVQGAATTFPTISVYGAGGSVPFNMPLGTTLPIAALSLAYGWQQNSVSGALPANASISGTGTVAGPRVGFRVS